MNVDWYFVLWLFIGICASIPLTFLSIFPIYGLLKLTDAFGRRRGQSAAQRIRTVLVALTAAMPVMVFGFWLAVVGVGNWLKLPHAVALHFGTVVGGCGMGGMMWIFIGASLDRMIKDD